MTQSNIPDNLVVLTFDDAVSNHASLAGPLLKQYGFGGTFFVCEFPPDFETNKEQYMSWEQMRWLHDQGFEIGNHTGHHRLVTDLTVPEFEEELDFIDSRCEEFGITLPTTFAYPGGPTSDLALGVLADRGCLFARTAEIRAFVPGVDNPLLTPSFPVHGKDPKVFYDALETGGNGRVPVLMFHGLPEYTHPWVNTPPNLFREYMRHLAENNYQVIALRDLAQYL